MCRVVYNCVGVCRNFGCNSQKLEAGLKKKTCSTQVELVQKSHVHILRICMVLYAFSFSYRLVIIVSLLQKNLSSFYFDGCIDCADSTMPGRRIFLYFFSFYCRVRSKYLHLLLSTLLYFHSPYILIARPFQLVSVPGDDFFTTQTANEKARDASLGGPKFTF